MTVPTASLYPSALDDDTNLFLVRDSLRVRLLDDYKPGDTSILVEGEEGIMERFPPTGIITLTEQCSDIESRAVSLHYSSRTSGSFDGLEILPEFRGRDSFKPRKITNVTMNVVAMHHNHLKDSLIALQSFLGTKHSTDRSTITGRIRYLERLALRPKAWFSADSTVGLAQSPDRPLKVVFKNDSFRLGYGWIRQTWDFGDGPPVVLTSESEEEYLALSGSVGGATFDGTRVTKAYLNPGVYTVRLTMENEWGSSDVEFKDFITAKTESPEEANITINHRPTQSHTDGDITTGARPKIRSLANSFVDLEVRPGQDPDRLGYSYGGELLGSSSSSARPIDPIVEYTWSLGDDLPHPNSPNARASYSLGGLYDIVLRVDTSFGSYRITKYEESIDIVEARNLWLFNFSAQNSDGSGSVKGYEFGLASETFKSLGNQTLSINRSNGFLSPYASAPYHPSTHSRAKAEFDRNTAFVPTGSASSGNKGNSIIFWAKGGSAADSNDISCARYNAFADQYDSLPSVSGRPWNWVALNSPAKSYFLFGHSSSATPNQNSAFGFRTDYDLSSQSAATAVALGSSSFENGADDLLQHPSQFDTATGLATNGYFATYRSAWKDSSGYILRNSAVNEFFRLASFYRTNGSLASPFNTLTRLPDITGSIKVEGQLVSMSNGIFMFNNSGEICAWNDTSLTWEVGRAGSSALTFRSVQDTNASDFDDRANTMLVASDGSRMAYISYDYSSRAFVKFNGVDLTFSTTRYRPVGRQFQMGVY